MKLIKPMARGLGAVLALRYLIGHRLLRVVLGDGHAWATTTEAIAKMPGVFGVYMRQACYRRLLDHVGNDVYFGFMSVVSKQQSVIGDRVYIGRFCTIGNAELEHEVMLADGVQVLSGRHQHGIGLAPGRSWQGNRPQFKRVKVGRGAWIGAGAIVMADVGPGAVVGAGAVVVQPVPAGHKVAGVPAVPLRQKAA